MTEHANITSRDGLTLEAEVDIPADATRAAVICHPHPDFGGTMRAPLLLALRDDLVARSFGVVRFNFRGVGTSEGHYGLGTDEVADALGAVDVAAERVPGAPIALLGWSFGGAVAIRAAASSGVGACAVVAPSVEPKERITAGLPPADELGLAIPLLLVIGANDELVSPAAAKKWAEGVDGARFVEMAGANHFFWAKYEELSRLIGDWLEEVLA